MSDRVFPLFPFLPPEVRRQIYVLAAEPRFVHVKEGLKKTWGEFREHYNTTVVIPKLDPSLAHFAHNWSHHIPSPDFVRETSDWACEVDQPFEQLTLDDFGFTTSKPRPEPWQPTDETPEIPLEWLVNGHPRIAWDLARESYLYSNTPAPALLQVCTESRAALIEVGYELAFRTRTHKPHTWFNFQLDTLVLHDDGRCPVHSSGRYALSHSRWDVGQYHPDDMKRVQKLCVQTRQMHEYNFALDVSSILRLFGSVKHLYLRDWLVVAPRSCCCDCGEHLDEEKSDAWRWVDSAEVDVLHQHIPARALDFEGIPSWPEDMGSTGRMNCLFWAYKRRHWFNGNGYFMSVRDKVTANLKAVRRSRMRDEEAESWMIPKVVIGHLVNVLAYDFMVEQRLDWRRMLLQMGLI